MNDSKIKDFYLDENINKENNTDKIIINRLNFIVYKQFLDTMLEYHTENEVSDAFALIKSKNIDLN